MEHLLAQLETWSTWKIDLHVDAIIKKLNQEAGVAFENLES